MTIIDSIKRSQTLLQHISSQENFNTEVTESLSSLQAELNTISSQAQQLSERLKQLQTSHNSTEHSQTTPKIPEMKSGCYIFEGEKAFFCPHCYDNHSHKVATARINKNLRVCPTCRASIK